MLLYASGHIPGAVKVDWTADLNDQLRRDYITREGFEALMSRIGVTNDTTVVFYGDKNNWWACYAFWVFKLFGHAKCPSHGRRPHQVGDGEPAGDTRRAASYPSRPTRPMSAPTTNDPRLPRRGAQALRRSGQLVDVRSPANTRGETLHMADYPQEGACAAATSPARAASPGRARSTRRHVQERRRAARRSTSRRMRPQRRTTDDRLLPHRRAQQPHLVRAQVPARLRERAQLRRLVDRVGQSGGCADREGTTTD